MVDEVRGVGRREGTHQQIVPVRVRAVGEPTRFFVFEITPGIGIGTVRIATVGIVWGDVGGSSTDIGSKELSRAIVELPAKVDDVLSETDILFLKLADAIQRAHLVVGEADSSLEPCDCLLKLGEGGGRVSGCNDRTEKRFYLFDVGLSLSTVASLGFGIPASLALVLGRKGGTRGGGGIGDCERYVVRRRRHHVRQSRK